MIMTFVLITIMNTRAKYVAKILILSVDLQYMHDFIMDVGKGC